MQRLWSGDQLNMNSLVITLAIVAVSGCIVEATSMWQKINSINFQIKEISKCEEDGSKDFDGNLRLNRKNRTLVVLEGNFTLKVPLDESMETTILVQYWGNGGWKLVYTFTNINICRDLAVLLGDGWTSLWVHAGIALPAKCPIPKGHYELKNFNTQDFMKAKVPAVGTGKFKLTQWFLRKGDKQALGCVVFIVELTSNSIFG